MEEGGLNASRMKRAREDEVFTYLTKNNAPI